MFSLIIFLDRDWQTLGLIYEHVGLDQNNCSQVILENYWNNCFFIYINHWCLFWDVISLYPSISYTGARTEEVGVSISYDNAQSVLVRARAPSGGQIASCINWFAKWGCVKANHVLLYLATSVRDSQTSALRPSAPFHAACHEVKK